MEQSVASPVVFEERAAGNGLRIGIARLNAEGTLNALTLEMIDLLGERLRSWAQDDSIAVVVLEAAGEKAFCAGGDMRRVRESVLEHRASAQRDDVRKCEYALQFYSREYRVDYLIHIYSKPVLCWGHGIVMGGGVGLMAGASHRVVTERSRVAMPEITIGLFPDVGGTWILGRMPGKLGLFLALTAAPLNASDAVFAGMADYALRQADKAKVFEQLLRQPWTRSGRENSRVLTDLLRGFPPAEMEPGPARRHFDLIGKLCAAGALPEVVAAITSLGADDPWLSNAAATLRAGSPSSAALSYELLRRARLLSLADVFRLELVAVMHCTVRPDLAEGVRALLVDKDRNPRWSPATLGEISREWVDGYFVSPWPVAEHPLADL